jgi:hypothetical protein
MLRARFGHEAWTGIAACLVLCAACAAFAHEAIDLAGDVLLARDTFDGMPHDSRIALAALALTALGIFAVGYLIRVLDRRGGFDLAAAARFVKHGSAIITGSLAVATLAAVPLMEWSDTLDAGTHIGSAADAYGGSLLLGIATCVLSALAFGMLARAAAAFLCAHEWRIAGLLGVRLGAQPNRAPCAQHLSPERAASHRLSGEPAARTNPLRAPPLLA